MQVIKTHFIKMRLEIEEIDKSIEKDRRQDMPNSSKKYGRNGVGNGEQIQETVTYQKRQRNPGTKISCKGGNMGYREGKSKGNERK